MGNAHKGSYIGEELDLFALAKNWKSYIKSQICCYTIGDVLEIGAGIGSTTMMLHDGTARHWVCIEPDVVLAKRLKARLHRTTHASTISVLAGSLRSISDRPRFDCILYIDVLEHIEDDRTQIAAAARLVRPSGHIVILAPAHQWLYGEFDKSIGHYRRYDKARLKSLMPSGWTEKRLNYIDSVGVFLSLGNVLALHQSMPTQSQIILWDRVCIPMSRALDRVLGGRVGKSILAVWGKGSDN